MEHLIRDVKNFVTANPREIVILNFRHYDKNKWPDSLERCLPYFNPIKNLLIPKTAHDLTINDIRKLYPSRSIILAFDHGTPQTWKPEWVQREQLWSLIHYYWNLDDSEEAIEKLVVESMLSPPLEAYWVLSAAARDNRGPKLLPPHHPIRVETFSPGKQNGNIILVDFVEKNETIISVTDKCIALNKQRAANTLPPTTPKNLIVKKINEANFQNTLEFNWERGDDNIGIRKYEIFNGNDFLFSTYNIPHREKNFPLSNYSFKVRSVNTIDQKSDFSVPFILIQDVIPPTAPQNFRISKLGLTALELEWKASFDAAGIAGYEVSIDNQAPQFTSELKIIFSNLATSQQHYSKVRAKDVNGMFSEYTELVIQPPPTKLLNPKLDIREIEENSDTYTGYISWDLIEAPNRTISYEYKVDGFLYAGIHEEGKVPKRFLVGSVNRPTTIEAYIAFFAGERGETSTYNFTFNPTPPHPVQNLKVQARTPAGTIIGWARSSSADVVSYAVSIDEAPPGLVSASASSYEFVGLPLNQTFLIEVWAINRYGVPSITESIIIDPLEGNPPRNFRVSNIYDQRITFAWSRPFAKSGKLVAYDFVRYVVGLPVTIPIEGLQEFLTIVDSLPQLTLTVKLRCVYEGGVRSDFVELIVPPRS